MEHVGGSIVNIVADMWGSMPGMAHSGAARADMVSLTETAALEWAHSGVRVNAVAPGYIASSGMDHYPPEQGPRLRAMATTVPLGRFGNEAETSADIGLPLTLSVWRRSSSAAARCVSTVRVRSCAWAGRPSMPAPQLPPGATPSSLLMVSIAQ